MIFWGLAWFIIWSWQNSIPYKHITTKRPIQVYCMDCNFNLPDICTLKCFSHNTQCSIPEHHIPDPVPIHSSKKVLFRVLFAICDIYQLYLKKKNYLKKSYGHLLLTWCQNASRFTQLKSLCHHKDIQYQGKKIYRSTSRTWTNRA